MAQTEVPRAVSKPCPSPPSPPPGREIHELFGETKRSKEARKKWKEGCEQRKQAYEQARKMTLIEQKEKGLR